MIKVINRGLSYVLVILMVVMVLDVLWQVFSRYILVSPSSFTDELARFLLIWIGVLGAAYASGQGSHLAINLLSDKLNEKQQVRLKVLQNLLICIFAFTAMILGGGRLVYITYMLSQNSPALNIPLFVIYAIIPISGVLILIYKLAEIISPKNISDGH
ncbi:TRAP transporter small permease [Fulvivirga sediminis]|uniref:TRAP transporter small permease n=1 Tax=Fulvivirga sediminis TaxID=2803949 RepID=A0A937F4I0_9BACT|nr:TRAP transporter small permease [Fulvivirga sediminis]MBL3656226.1 TRAP transporter small permease [Fulvivirga sediminis]